MPELNLVNGQFMKTGRMGVRMKEKEIRPNLLFLVPPHESESWNRVRVKG